ncbi:unnamed protein product [Mytilus coruscus]|uniref:Endonuclease/exonuclease/phosphatase domain-containing protein n=1 Tax=Mytilus coruscus TaxID=42192 RepID=A0A6J8CKW2_MYTCO|nr:unnamed protein product [Mytilus coruscus]
MMSRQQTTINRSSQLKISSESLDTDSHQQEKSTYGNRAPTSSVQHNVDYTNPHSQSYPYNTYYSRYNNIPITNFNDTPHYQWGNGGTYHNVPTDSRDPYYPYYHNWYNYQDYSHMNYYPETRTSDYNIHGNWWGYGGTYHNVPTETFHHSYNQHSTENQVCFSNLISLTPTQQSANSVSNTEVKCRKKASTLRFHNPSTYSTGTTNQTPKEKESSKIYGNGSFIVREKNDIFLLQEHWLYDCQLNILQELHNDFTGTGKAVNSNDRIQPYHMPRGYGGVAILWKKNLDKLVTTLPIGNERIQCIELSGNQKLLFISIYLPCKSSDNHLNELHECIDQLHEIMEVYKATHKIIIGGDFNENIFNENNSNRKRYILDFMSDHNLSTTEVGITYTHTSGMSSSAIDYILFQEKFRDCIINIEKPDIISNVSDHLPILLQLKYELPCRNFETEIQSTINHKVKWNKIDKDKYKNLVEEGIALLKAKPMNPTDLDEAFQTLNHTITKATLAVAPKKKKKMKKKKLQIMTENISQAISEKKIAFFKWKQNGRPPDPNNPFTIQKKITTSSLRKQCRVEAALHRIQEHQKIIDAGYNDSALFYSLIKNKEGWSKHFGDLAKKSNNNSFDTKYLNSIEKEATHIIKMCKDKYKHQEITTEEIKKAVSKLNTNKAEDIYGLTAEHFIHGSESLLQHLQQLLNVCFKFCYIPDLLKIGTLFPVFKNKGDIKNAKNYRGITITPTYSKIIEKILKERKNPKIIISQNPLQKGFTEDTSPLICELFIEEFERESKDLKLPVYIALLDGKSAFDVVVHANLIRRMFQIDFTE